MRRTIWILWLMLALLPLRGWAVASMGVGMAAAERAAVVEAGHSMPSSVALPDCHQAADDAAGTGTCQACDWCHAALGLAPQAPTAAAAPPTAGPVTAVDHDTGRPLLGRLDRPPRTSLA